MGRHYTRRITILLSGVALGFLGVVNLPSAISAAHAAAAAASKQESSGSLRGDQRCEDGNGGSDDGGSDDGGSDDGGSDDGGSDDGGSDDGGSDDGGSDDGGSDDGSSNSDHDSNSGESSRPSSEGSSGHAAVVIKQMSDHVGDSRDYVPNELMAANLTSADLQRLTDKGYKLRARAGQSLDRKIVTLQVPAGIDLASAAREVLSTNRRAVAAANDYYYVDAGGARDGTRFVGASYVGWLPTPAPRCAALPTIGMIDTTINTRSPVLAGSTIETFESQKAKAAPSDSAHGTAVASLFVGHGDVDGLVPAAHVIAVNTFYHDEGGKDRSDTAGLVQAIDYLVGRGVGVINLSLSGPANPVLADTIAAARRKGVAIIASAGNEGPSAPPAYPAAYPGVIAVTAVDQHMNIYRQANRGDYVDVAAPGVGLWVADRKAGGKAATGTSFAAPFATAAAALLKASNPRMSPDEISKRLVASAHDLGDPGADSTFGAGLLQLDPACFAGDDMTVASIKTAPVVKASYVVPASGQ